jgi:hypothetical protein
MISGYRTKVRSLRGVEQGDEVRLHRFPASQETVHDLHDAGEPHVGARITELLDIPFDQQQVPGGFGGVGGQIERADVRDEISGAGQPVKPLRVDATIVHPRIDHRDALLVRDVFGQHGRVAFQ